MGNVVTLPRHSRVTRKQAEHVRQLALDLEIPEDACAILENALYKITEVPGKRWTFLMINPQQFRFVAKAIAQRPDAGKTLMIWNCALTYVRMDTGEILASREQLAEDAETLPRHVSTAMTELSKIGAITRTMRGRKAVYSINPNVGWAGGEGTRLEAAADVPKLRLVPQQLDIEDAITATDRGQP